MSIWARGFLAGFVVSVGVTVAAENSFSETEQKNWEPVPIVKKEETAVPYGRRQMMLRRAQAGFVNITYGFFEPANQLRLEINQTDAVRGFVPGLTKGIGSLIEREVLGVFQMVTFYLRREPHLKQFDTDWLHV